MLTFYKHCGQEREIDCTFTKITIKFIGKGVVLGIKVVVKDLMVTRISDGSCRLRKHLVIKTVIILLTRGRGC